MKKIMQIVAFSLVTLMVFTSAKEFRGFDFWGRKVVSATEPAPDPGFCNGELYNMVEDPSGLSYWVLYNKTYNYYISPDMIWPDTIEDYLLANGASNYECKKVFLIIE